MAEKKPRRGNEEEANKKPRRARHNEGSVFYDNTRKRWVAKVSIAPGKTKRFYFKNETRCHQKKERGVKGFGAWYFSQRTSKKTR